MRSPVRLLMTIDNEHGTCELIAAKVQVCEPFELSERVWDVPYTEQACHDQGRLLFSEGQPLHSLQSHGMIRSRWMCHYL